MKFLLFQVMGVGRLITATVESTGEVPFVEWVARREVLGSLARVRVNSTSGCTLLMGAMLSTGV